MMRLIFIMYDSKYFAILEYLIFSQYIYFIENGKFNMSRMPMCIMKSC